MLIGFCGAGGTGKTTTAKALAEAIGLPFRASSSRPVFDKWGLKTEREQLELPVETQWELQADIFQAREAMEVGWGDRPDGVCDRTLLDQACYSLLRAHGVVDSARYSDMMRRVISSLRRYHALFYFPLVDYPTKDDGMRDTIVGSRVVFTAVMQQLSTAIKMSVFVVPTHRASSLATPSHAEPTLVMLGVAERVAWIREKIHV